MIQTIKADSIYDIVTIKENKKQNVKPDLYTSITVAKE